jgi:CDGSH-type Zn-finger protein
MSDQDKEVVVEVTKDGPYIVKGVERMVDAEGNAIPIQPVMALCRCGTSKNKPFCDGAHKEIDFKG